ncbi:hypothetical protein I317_03645 [Kwoniella heveanensis CBS 569]|uniref:TauD/TfdA-like domain-containing protein n=1 Tax=Kwoniella heveanensis BCC8398 TaxID=1296120 RepID=A0A1B9GU03_9TREE|nr:hypothetical protein I316_03558 [Kwoniella heveanensis BCC8398]OCF42529.1 hypothetical protein I317_03645 [Kwoniella heveanensis CBS 569]
MAPQTRTETQTQTEEVTTQTGRLNLVGGGEGPQYPQYLPSVDHTTFPDWEEIPYVDAGTRGTPDKRHLFLPGSTHKPLTPRIGEEIRGVQISQLSKEGLDDLALLAAERGVLVFRGQDFKDIGPERQLDTVRHFGRLHIHPTMPYPEGLPEMHVVYKDPASTANAIKPNETQSISSVVWHADHTAERQPPGITFFFALEVPSAGGDTLFVSATEAYKLLSDGYKERLEGLKIVHDNTSMIEYAKSRGAPARFNPSKHAHPLIRTHPATGAKIVAAIGAGEGNGQPRYIEGFKREESEATLRLLNDVLQRSGDIQARATYEPGTVVVWDNRVVGHTPVHDFEGERRHFIRIAAMAEKPF